MSGPVSRLERNKAAVRRFKESQDGVGILLQLGALDMLAGLGCKPLT